jgi:hypothetical protein
MKRVVLWMTLALAFVGALGFRSVLARQNRNAEGSAEKLPADVHPETLSRMPQATRDEFTSDEERQAFDHLVAAEPRYGRPSNGVLAATGTRLHIPVVADAYRTALHNLQQQNGLEQKYVELATIVASRESNGEEPWLSHEGAAVMLTSRAVVEIVRNKQDAKGLDEKEQAVIQLGREMFRGPKVSSKTFANMERLFGRKGTLAITLLMAHYETNTLLYRVYDQHLAPGTKRPFPDVLASEAKKQAH